MLYSIISKGIFAILCIGFASTGLFAQNKVYKFDRSPVKADTVEVEELDLTGESTATINLEVEKDEEEEETVEAKKRERKMFFMV